MKKPYILAALVASTMLVSGCSRVEPGHVGIKVSQYGSGAGVSNESLGVGTYFSGFGTTIYEYPIYTNTYTWTRSTDEGKSVNEEFSFADKNGVSVTADVAVAYHVDAAKAPVLFQKYRQTMEEIVAGPLRNAVRNSITVNASNMTVEEIYGSRKAELIAKTQADVSRYFTAYGLVVEQIYWASPVRVPESIQQQISARVKNEQEALAAQAAVATAEANARARVAEAEGQAKATKIEAEAISSNPQILTQRAIEKWDGHYPQYVGGGMPLPTIKLSSGK